MLPIFGLVFTSTSSWNTAIFQQRLRAALLITLRPSAATDAEGAYTLMVPTLRDEEGTPVDGSFTLRVQAALYQEFPTAIRPALPLDATTAQSTDDGWVIENPFAVMTLLVLYAGTIVIRRMPRRICDPYRGG